MVIKAHVSFWDYENWKSTMAWKSEAGMPVYSRARACAGHPDLLIPGLLYVSESQHVVVACAGAMHRRRPCIQYVVQVILGQKHLYTTPSLQMLT